MRRWEQLLVHQIGETKRMHKINPDQYRKKVISLYGGHRGALLVRSSGISGHFRYGDRLFRRRQFDLRGVKDILDIGSGAGQVLSHLIRYSNPSTNITGIDISLMMLGRAQKRLKSNRPRFVLGDLAQLPFANQAFDCVTCCYVLEHVPDVRQGLEEIARVLKPSGRVLLFVTEDNFSGAWTSRFWKCSTQNREKLINLCETLGLDLKKEFWFTRLHRLLRAGGICVELVKQPTGFSVPQSEQENVNVGFVENKPPGLLQTAGIQALQSEPVEGETSVSTRTRSIVSSN
jgi:ubiquinone/menaquinone biosynthesis C-methylase UbiE